MVDEVWQAGAGLRERKKLRTRAMLIDAAVELCNRQGFEKTTVEQISAVADVSPRTFSRYFATKDAVVVALIDEVAAMAAVELAGQPPEINDVEALYRAHVQAFLKTRIAPSPRLTEQRLLALARIVTSSPVLMHTVSEFRIDAVNAVLATRMGVSRDDRRLKLTSAVWGAVIMSALAELGPDTDWATMTVDGIVAKVQSTYGEFMAVTAGLHGMAGQLV
ncbi:TetR/AcrR family transcriptional regulator [Mycobacterium sp. NPDC003449]